MRSKCTLSIALALTLVCGIACAEDKQNWKTGTVYNPNNPTHVAAAQRFGEPQTNTGMVGVDFGEGLRMYKNQADANAYMKTFKDKAEARVANGEAAIRWDGQVLGTPEQQAAYNTEPQAAADQMQAQQNIIDMQAALKTMAYDRQIIAEATKLGVNPANPDVRANIEKNMEIRAGVEALKQQNLKDIAARKAPPIVYTTPKSLVSMEKKDAK